MILGYRRATAPQRHQAFMVGLLCGSLVVGVAGVVASHYIKSPAQAAAEAAAPPPTRLTVAVERRVLEKTVISRGKVGAAKTVEVIAATGRDAQRPVLTAVRVKAGQSVGQGQVLAEVSGRPVVLLRGALPAYRDLLPGAEGPDVRQLQVALRATGHSTGSDDGAYFGAGTKAALTALYQQLGYTPVTATEDEEERLSAARLQVRRAKRALLAAQQQEPPTDGDEPGDGQPAPGDDTTVADARDALDVAERDLYRLERSTGPTLPAYEVIFVPTFPVRVDRVTGTVGTQPRGAVMTLSTGELVIRGQVLPSERALIRKGQKVKISSEATGLSATGVIAAVGIAEAGPATTPASGEEPDPEAGGEEQGTPTKGGDEAFLEVHGTKALDRRLIGQDVRLTIVAASTKTEVLVVPLAAVTARADGTTQLVRITADGREEYIEVVAGTSGDGYVEVTPSSATLRPDDKVVVGR